MGVYEKGGRGMEYGNTFRDAGGNEVRIEIKAPEEKRETLGFIAKASHQFYLEVANQLDNLKEKEVGRMQHELLNRCKDNAELQSFLEEKRLTLDDLGCMVKLIEHCNKISFKEYLTAMLGNKKANKILRMSRKEKESTFIIITGRQGPTGKTALARVLRNHGYRTLELYEHELVELNEELQFQIPQFSMFVE